ncbi:MAG: aminomethyl-transferring glycine dehydrogenase subunit GcvPA [Conexivisphaerales archaeon]
MKKYSHLLPNDKYLNQMLTSMGISSVDELFTDIPHEARLKGKLNVSGPMGQMEIERKFRDALSTDKVHPSSPCFLGGGIWPHYIPAAVNHIISRSEFYTSYTSYQPEISQGVLQALFEYQSLICELGNMDAANASMYDWPTAAAEAVRMAMRITKKRRVVVSAASGFERRKVIETYIEPAGGKVVELPFNAETGETELHEAEMALAEQDVAAIYIEQPNFFGVIESRVREFSELAKRKGALFIVGVEPTSLGILEAPGNYGADIMVGEGQPLGISMSYGGPSLGIFAAKGDLNFIRQMPGRIIGLTSEKDGKGKGYVMVLQTREQHIRREKATSNICTNQALMAIAAASYIALLGKEGFIRLAKTIVANSHYVSKRIEETGRYISPFFTSEFYSDFAFARKGEGPRGHELFEKLASKGVHAALPLGWFYNELKEVNMISVTEAHNMRDVELLTKALLEV